MLYKPKFCCQCGEPIERANWKLLTSRRFCDLCETDYRFDDLIPKATVALGVLLGIVSLATFFQKPDKPLNLASGNSTNINKAAVNRQTATDGNTQAFVKIPETNPVAAQSSAKAPIVAPTPNLKSQKIENNPNATAETIYFCGAETKKGTPCTRRVRGGGRCWQHVGKPAMLAPEKLIASD